MRKEHTFRIRVLEMLSRCSDVQAENEIGFDYLCDSWEERYVYGSVQALSRLISAGTGRQTVVPAKSVFNATSKKNERMVRKKKYAPIYNVYGFRSPASRPV